MRTLHRLVLLSLAVLGLSLSAQAKPESVPDYFPAPLGAEWHYDVRSSAGYTRKKRTVVSERTDAAEMGYNIVLSDFTPLEVKTYFLKQPGWVLALKSEVAASSYSAAIPMDYVADKKELMNPLKVGGTWDYKGKVVSGTLELDCVENWEILGIEEVTVPAGSYQAMKVTRTSNLDGDITKFTFWYVDSVGPVRILTESNGEKNDEVLTKLIMPK